MKKLLFICAAVVLAAACNSGDKYTIKGTVTGDSDKLVNGTAYLFNRDSLENAQVTITTDTTFAEPVITGGPTQTLLNRYGEQSKALGEKYDIMNVIKDMRRPTSTEAVRDSAIRIYSQYQEELDAVREALTAEAPVSDFALYFIMQNREYYYMTPEATGPCLSSQRTGSSQPLTNTCRRN